jgi:hypothetical protein
VLQRAVWGQGRGSARAEGRMLLLLLLTGQRAS